MASKRPQPNKKAPHDPEPRLQYKYKGQYETGRIATARLLFAGIRILTLFSLFSLLVKPTSKLSIFTKLQQAYPSKPPTLSLPSIPLIPDSLLSNLPSRLDMDPNFLIVFSFLILFSRQFTSYNILWRRERLPLTGDGGALKVSIALFLIDLVHIPLYLYTSALNPTWKISLFRITPLLFVPGLAIQFSSDQTKHLFKEDERNKGKVLTRGAWGVVRHPNYAGYLMWRVAFATAVGGWTFGGLSAWVHTKAAAEASIPSIEMHMEKTYGKRWDEVRGRVRWKLIPRVY